ncbi:MAG: 4-hydroxybutyrate dehydrogenase [Clostridia bacterium]|nr:4-hydroxybutyrate dehydrogenase [Clostridia bacterium]
MAFMIRPVIERYADCAAFAEAFQIGERDLLITNRYLYDPFFAPLGLKCQTVFQEEFGAGEPTDVMIDGMYQAVRKLSFDRIIAAGGGTVMDISKLFALERMYPVADLCDGTIPMKKTHELILLPTTCGTGSEVTCLAAINLTRRGTKIGFGGPEMFADRAVLVPELLRTLPMKFFATSSIDAFIHSIESYVSPKATPDSKLFSMTSMKMILRGYMTIREKGEDARFTLSDDFLTAATYGGIAFGNAGTGAVHAMSYPFGGTYHVPHGESNRVIFPGVFDRYMMKDPNGRIRGMNEELAGVLGCDADGLYPELRRLFDVILPLKPLHEYGMKPEECELFAQSVEKNQKRLTRNNYTPLTVRDYTEIYESLY